jgi:AbrB family looped-hinge helix DNA binding protein
MTAISAQISDKYQVVIPKEVRQKLNLQPRDVLLFLIDGDSVFIRPKPASFTKKLRGLHKEIWPADTEQWLAGERASWELNLQRHEVYAAWERFMPESGRPAPPADSAHPPDGGVGR